MNGITTRGYRALYVPGHPRGGKTGMVLEHILVVESALGHFLPRRAAVHHIDENKLHNANGNLVACEDQAYHLLLHRRMRALAACGDADAVKCWYCGTWAKPSEMDGFWRSSWFHKACAATWQAADRLRRRGGRPNHRELLAARPHCKHGHTWTSETTRMYDGVRYCIECERERGRRRTAERRGARS